MLTILHNSRLYISATSSVSIWQGHSLQCTESFMRENVMEEMQQIQPEDETKRKMLDILKRFHSEEMNSDDEDGMFIRMQFLFL